MNAAGKRKVEQSITNLERAIEQARQATSDLMASTGAGQGFNTGHIKDIQTTLRSMGSDLSMLRSSLNAIR